MREKEFEEVELDAGQFYRALAAHHFSRLWIQRQVLESKKCLFSVHKSAPTQESTQPGE